MKLFIQWLSLTFILISTHVTLAADNKITNDITQFDYPFLLGDWVLINDSPVDESQNYHSIHLKLQSDYSFFIQIQKLDNTIEYWDGTYEVSGETLVLGTESIDPQAYNFVSTHNRLILNGVALFKMVSRSISGAWLSEKLTGSEITSLGIDKMLLILQPDFVFYFKASNATGKEVLHNGVYYFEGDNLVLVYESGELNTLFSIKNNIMKLTSFDGSMNALLTRMQ